MKTKAILSVLLLLTAYCILLTANSEGSVPSLINYQGVLKDSTGVPYHGPATMIFSIWDDSTNGNKLWQETHPVVEVSHGLFNVLLGSVDNPIPDSVFDQPNTWLEILVNGSLLSPRRQMVSVGYAFTDGDWTIDGDNIYREQGKVGIGTTISSETKLEIKGSTSDLSANTLRLINSNDEERFRVDNAGIVYSYTSSDGNLYIGTYGYNETNNIAYAMHALLERQNSLRVGDREVISLGFRANDDGGGFPDRRFGSEIFSVAENPENTTRKSGLGFSTTDSGQERPSERMRITGDGNVGIGTTSPQGTLDIKAHTGGWSGGLTLTSQDGLSRWRLQTQKTIYGGAFRLSDDDAGPDLILMPNGDLLPQGSVGIGTSSPQYKLDVEGYVQAHGYYTGDIVFQKDKEKLWRMFEDDDGLYLENLRTGKVYRFVLQEVEKE